MSHKTVHNASELNAIDRNALRTRLFGAAHNNSVVLGNFQIAIKITGEAIDAWCRITRQVPSAILFLFRPDNVTIEANIRSRCGTSRCYIYHVSLYFSFLCVWLFFTLFSERNGLAKERLFFGESLSPDAHVKRLVVLDLYLDSGLSQFINRCS